MLIVDCLGSLLFFLLILSLASLAVAANSIPSITTGLVGVVGTAALDGSGAGVGSDLAAICKGETRKH